MASHSSGIPVSAALRERFGEVHASGNKRLLKVQIVNEEIVPVSDMDAAGSFEDDLDQAINLLEPKSACYLLVRMDEKADNGYRWVLDCYVPDAAPVREKMVYASSRAVLKMTLGGGVFAHDIFGTVRGDFNKAGFAAYLRMQKSAAPLTESEEAKAFERQASAEEAAACGVSQSMVHGVSFNASDEARDAVARAVDGKGQCYVQLSIDEARELIILQERADGIDIAGLAAKVPLDRPAFHFLRHDHDYEGSRFSSVIYVYSCPDGSGRTKSAPVKARMLFSSCKGGVEALAQGRVDLRLEINDGIEVSEQVIMHKLHPPPAEQKEAFAKPKPAGKGPRRLIR